MYLVQKSLQESMALKNVLNLSSTSSDIGKYCIVNGSKYFTIEYLSYGMAEDSVLMSSLQRSYLKTFIGQSVQIDPFFPARDSYVKQVILSVNYLKDVESCDIVHNTDNMQIELRKLLDDNIISIGEPLLFKDLKKMLIVTVLDMVGSLSSNNYNYGLINRDTSFYFVREEGSEIVLQGSKYTTPKPKQIISPDFKFEDLGIGGLAKEFSVIFRRAFASRIYPTSLIEKLGISHIKGVLLYGPPGTGKTLIARQIGKMLNSKPPKIISGPEVLNKYVGQSEENIRGLFADSEADYQKYKDESPLHIIIFDEIDAICKKRGSRGDSTGVGDSIVNQLLSKIDGVNSLNNILMIGMTNRLDMIDDALLRPGRFEVQLEIGLPDLGGRVEILNIHTKKMRENNLLEDFNLTEIAEKTENFSGAELAGLIKSATSFSFNKYVKVDDVVEPEENALSEFRVTKQDIEMALTEVVPMFGVDNAEFEKIMENSYFEYSPRVYERMNFLTQLLKQLKNNSNTHLITTLIHGSPGSGKTTTAIKAALDSDFPFIKFVSNSHFVGDDELSKAYKISQVFDNAHKSEHSLVILDSLETLVNYSPIGPRFSNHILQTILTLCNTIPPKGRKLMVITTTNYSGFFQDAGFVEICSETMYIPGICLWSDPDVLNNVLEDCNILDQYQFEEWCEFYRRQCEKNCSKIRLVGIKKIYQLIRRVESGQENDKLEDLKRYILD